MSRTTIGALLLIFVAFLAFGYSGVIPLGDTSPRPVDDSAVDEIAADDPVELGEAIYNRDCFGCHSIDGSSSVGPTLQGLYGAEATYDDGSTITIDEDHLLLAITDPRATNREGYPDVMPAFDNLEDEEIDGLIAFIRSLE